MEFTSLFAQLYIAIQNQIKQQVPAIAYIAYDIGQLETYEVRPPVSWPCVLISFPAAQYSNHSEGVQWADFQVSLRLGFSPFSTANSVAPDISVEAALQFFELENKLYAAIHGFTADNCIQPLIRITAATEERTDAYIIRQIMFTSGTEDDTAMESQEKHKADLELDFE